MKKEQHSSNRKIQLRRALLILSALGVIGIAVLSGINWYVVSSGQTRIYSLDDTDNIPHTECILVLGAGLKEDGTPNFMLKDRLDTAISLYHAGISNRLLMTGDHGQKEYDEVNAMKQYALDAGIPSEAIFMDHAGFSTYESACRAKKIFLVKSTIVITQEYHLYRAVYDISAFGIEAYGVPAKDISYKGQWIRDTREILARAKDALWCFVKPDPSYLGNPIDILGDGNQTNG